MEDVEVVLERHEQRIKTLERDMTVMKEVQSEIRSRLISIPDSSMLAGMKSTPSSCLKVKKCETK